MSLETKLEKMKSVKGKVRNVEEVEESVTSLNALESLKPVDKAVVEMTEIVLQVSSTSLLQGVDEKEDLKGINIFVCVHNASAR